MRKIKFLVGSSASIATLMVSMLALFLLPIVITAQTAEEPVPLVDAASYRQTFIDTIDLWNGGLDGSSGMGTYAPDFNGFFHVTLDRRWQPMPQQFSTSVAQSRAIYINVEAYRAAGPDEGARFLKAVHDGVDGLMTFFHDPEYGGFYWEMQPNGQPRDDQKHGYGNVHPLFALAHAYAVTDNPDHLAAALDQLAIIKTHFLDPDYPGALLPGRTRDFSEVVGQNNIEAFTHFFEALLVLHDVTSGTQQAEIDELIVLHGDFLAQHLYHDQAGYTDRGYVAYNYDREWQPQQIPYSRDRQWWDARHASAGHNIELAYLLSRAVERGFDETWLIVAEKLIRFCQEHAFDPTSGGMIYDITDYDGQPLPDNPDNDVFIWWPQAETARTFLHFTVVRGTDDAQAFKQVEALINDHLTDAEYGGWYHGLSRNLEPVGLEKGDIWKVAYHYSMFFAEVLRLAEEYPLVMAQPVNMTSSGPVPPLEASPDSHIVYRTGHP